MRFQKGIRIIAILAIVAASGCSQESKDMDSSASREVVTHRAENTGEANESNTTPPTSHAKTGSKTLLYQKDFRQDKPSLENFQEGVFFELSDHVEDFFTQDIAEKVQNNMEAIVDHDAAKFKQNMLSENDIKANIDWFDYMNGDGVKFEFSEVNEISYEEDSKRIQVVVSFYRNINHKEIEQGVMTYSLLKDKASGAWLIALMD
ncbi:hypothetical protein [Paenibacillus sp. VMFN-D1]|uniref:hypothetical protein n=1 Tax=Paenibacillus sp. VMFN-D1 TaxID=2135608 RepID=UPI000E282146|nr:hypothetical protein [Paenibacillus sp. VMFN-D1]